MIEDLVRDRCPTAIRLAEAMVDVLRGIPGPRDADRQSFYEDACWARAAIAAGMPVTEMPPGPAVTAAQRAGPIIPDEWLWAWRVSTDPAPVRMVYLIEVAAILRLGDHPVPMPRTAPRVLRQEVGRWNRRVAGCADMLRDDLGTCVEYLRGAVTPPPYTRPVTEPDGPA